MCELKRKKQERKSKRERTTNAIRVDKSKTLARLSNGWLIAFAAVNVIEPVCSVLSLPRLLAARLEDEPRVYVLDARSHAGEIQLFVIDRLLAESFTVFQNKGWRLSLRLAVDVDDEIYEIRDF